jgi:hypothetical protein
MRPNTFSTAQVCIRFSHQDNSTIEVFDVHPQRLHGRPFPKKTIWDIVFGPKVSAMAATAGAASASLSTEHLSVVRSVFTGSPSGGGARWTWNGNKYDPDTQPPFELAVCIYHANKTIKTEVTMEGRLEHLSLLRIFRARSTTTFGNIPLGVEHDNLDDYKNGMTNKILELWKVVGFEPDEPHDQF